MAPVGMYTQRVLLSEAFRGFKHLFHLNDGAHTIAMVMVAFSSKGSCINA